MDLKMGANLIIPYEKDGPHKVVVISLFLIFGTLLGLSNGFIISLLIRFQNLKTTSTRYSKVLVLLVFVLLCLSFLGFCWSKPYTLSFMGYIWLITAIVLYLYRQTQKRPINCLQFILSSFSFSLFLKPLFFACIPMFLDLI